MATKFAEFIETSKIDPRRILTASRQLERLRTEDRTLRMERRKRGKPEKGAAEAETPAPAKPRSGRPVTQQLLDRVNAGKKVPGAAKSRLLRAVNRVLEQKKQDPVDLRALF